MTEAEWLEWRRRGIGASDAPAILGVCPHRTRLDVYLSKTHPQPPRTRAERQVWGHRLEDDIAEGYADRTGHPIVEHQKCLASEVYPWMRATIDGVRDDGRIVEYKALGLYQCNQFKAQDGDWEALEQNWIVQVHHQMVVADADDADLAVLLPLELRVYTIPRSERLCNLIVDLTGELWECVADRTPPRTLDPRDHERLKAAYPRAYGEIALDDPALVEAAHRYHQCGDKAAEVALLDAMGESESATLADGTLVRRKAAQVKGYVVQPKTRITLTVELNRDGASE